MFPLLPTDARSDQGPVPLPDEDAVRRGIVRHLNPDAVDPGGVVGADVYRNPSLPVATSGTLLNGGSLIQAETYTHTGSSTGRAECRRSPISGRNVDLKRLLRRHPES